jgi:hypothetical protein
MTNLTFPTHPHTGQIYSVGTRSYIYNEGTNSWAIYTNDSQVVTTFTSTYTTINGTTISTSTITGALTVTGGVGIGGAINVGSTSTVGGAQIITTSTLDSFARKILLYAGTDTAIYVTATSTSTSYTIWNTSTLQSVTDRGNTTTNIIKILNITNSTSTVTGALVVTGGVGIGQDLYVGGMVNIANTGTMVGAEIITTATYRYLFKAGTDISITSTSTDISLKFSNTSTLQSVTNRGTTTTNIVNFTNTTNSTSTTTGAVTIAGGLGVGGRINSESIQIADAILDSTQISINTTDTTEIDRYPADQYRTAKYLIQVDEGMGAGAEFEAVEIMLIVNNNQQVFATEYGAVRSGVDLGDFAADVQNDNFVRLYYTAFNPTNKLIKVLRTAMTV